MKKKQSVYHFLRSREYSLKRKAKFQGCGKKLSKFMILETKNRKFKWVSRIHSQKNIKFGIYGNSKFFLNNFTEMVDPNNTKKIELKLDQYKEEGERFIDFKTMELDQEKVLLLTNSNELLVLSLQNGKRERILLCESKKKVFKYIFWQVKDHNIYLKSTKVSGIMKIVVIQISPTIKITGKFHINCKKLKIVNVVFREDTICVEYTKKNFKLYKLESFFKSFLELNTAIDESGCRNNISQDINSLISVEIEFSKLKELFTCKDLLEFNFISPKFSYQTKSKDLFACKDFSSITSAEGNEDKVLFQAKITEDMWVYSNFDNIGRFGILSYDQLRILQLTDKKNKDNRTYKDIAKLTNGYGEIKTTKSRSGRLIKKVCYDMREFSDFFYNYELDIALVIFDSNCQVFDKKFKLIRQFKLINYDSGNDNEVIIDNGFIIHFFGKNKFNNADVYKLLK